jgi:hypothetical protein
MMTPRERGLAALTFLLGLDAVVVFVLAAQREARFAPWLARVGLALAFVLGLAVRAASVKRPR